MGEPTKSVHFPSVAIHFLVFVRQNGIVVVRFFHVTLQILTVVLHFSFVAVHMIGVVGQNVIVAARFQFAANHFYLVDNR